jgi:hypothetical protein
MSGMPRGATIGGHTRDNSGVMPDVATDNQQGVLDTYIGVGGLPVQLVKDSVTRFRSNGLCLQVNVTEQLERKEHSKFAFWVIRSLEGDLPEDVVAGKVDAKTALEALSADFADRPFFVGVRGHVSEALVIYRKKDSDKHKDSNFRGFARQTAFGFKRGGHPGKKLIVTLEAFLSDCRCYLTNMSVVHSADGAEDKAEPFRYEELELEVSHWGIKKFEHFKGDVAIKTRNKLPLTQFENDCSAVFPLLTTWVRHREEVSDDVFYLDSDRFHKQCPGSYEDDATVYAKRLQLVRWSQKRQTVIISTVAQWIDGDEHERSSMVLFASPETGKSKLAHLLAQESQTRTLDETTHY